MSVIAKYLSGFSRKRVYENAIRSSVKYYKHRDIAKLNSQLNANPNTQIHVKVPLFTGSSLREKIDSGEHRELYSIGVRDEAIRLLDQVQHLDKSVVGVYLTCIGANVLISLDAVDEVTDNMRVASINPIYYKEVLAEALGAWELRALGYLLSGGLLAFVTMRVYLESKFNNESRDLYRLQRIEKLENKVRQMESQPLVSSP